MVGEVLLLSDSDAIVAATTTVLESLDQKVLHLESHAILNEQLNDARFLSVLVAFQQSDFEQTVIDLVKAKAPQLPVYLLRQDDQVSKDCPELLQVSGIIPLPIRYHDVVDMLRKAQLKQSQYTNENNSTVNIIGNSTQTNKIKCLIQQVAPTDANVLLSGESGTGKEVVARAIHNASLRTGRPFVAVNCGAIPPELLESELFGHEKGSFTGAFQARAGRFELAEGGTLFLDEIGDMPLNMQVKLLRVIQERTFERVGGTKTLKCDVRIIAATHQDLEKRIDDGGFRTDLYYRLNVFPIELPALRERGEDVPLLIEEFVKRRNKAKQSTISFDQASLEMLKNHPLPGNVRELENLVERLSILYPGERITCEKLPQRYRHLKIHSVCDISDFPQQSHNEITNPVPAPDQVINLKQYLCSLERSLICRALEESDWVVTQAAKSLSVQRTTLIEKIRKLEIKQQDQADTRIAL